MDRGVNTLFTSLSTCKILRFLSIIARRDFSKGCYVTTYGIPFILWCLSLLFNLSWKTFFISELIRSSGCSVFQNRFSKPFSDVHKLLICGACPRTTDFLVQYGWTDKKCKYWWWLVCLTYTSIETLPFLKGRLVLIWKSPYMFVFM